MTFFCLSLLLPSARRSAKTIRQLQEEKSRINEQITKESSDLNDELHALAAMFSAPLPTSSKEKAR